jgi:hypothetical protein
MVVAEPDDGDRQDRTSESEAAMYPTVFDLDVWSAYQMTTLYRVRQQTRQIPSPRARLTLARVLIALARLLHRPEPDVGVLCPHCLPS